MKLLLLFAALAAVAYFAAEADAADPPKRRPITVDDLFRFARVADPQISPDGKRVAYQVTTVDLDANKTSTAVWVADADGKRPPRAVTASGKRDAHPRWSPDGTKLLFESNRGGSPQLYVLDLAAGGEAVKITDISTGAGSGQWSPDGQLVGFVSAVYPEFSELPFAESDKKNKEKDEAAEKNPVKAKVFTKLFFRHWDEYVGDKRQHVFVVGADGQGCRDVTPGDRDAVPTSSTFSSGDDFAFTPDSEHLIVTAVPEKGEAWSTNHDLCRVSVTNTSPKWESLTGANKAADGGPRFGAGGTRLAYRSQKKAGYEADKWDLIVVPVKPDGTFDGPAENLTANRDVSVADFVWAGPAKLVFAADENGESAMYEVRSRGGRPPERFYFSEDMRGQVQGLSAAPARDPNELTVAVALARMSSPAEVYVGRIAQDSEPRRTFVNVSRANDALLSQLDLPRPESVQVPVEGGVKMQMWVLKPPGFDPSKKWPVVYLVHGGPQGAWEDGWSYRWNPEVWAARGYVVALPNPRGSTGFGQKFVDEITGDWGGKCYRDLVAGLDFVEKLPFVDKDRVATAGASFGGYMMNWFAVNDIAPRFKCLINHCSVWNFESMWGTTEELWFDEHDHGGLPWEQPKKYREFSPHTRAGELGKHKVPMLVIHNDLDFRCPIGQGHELFTTLQRQGVPSRMVNFPDEGHWVTKPKNSRYWHQEVFAWLEKYAPPGGK